MKRLPIPSGARHPVTALLLAAIMAAVTAACSSTRSIPTITAPTNAPAPPDLQPPPVPEPAEPALPGTTAGSTPADMALCSPPETKPKPKPKPKPRPIHKEAPPQLPTSPAVADTPADGVVNAEVKPMSVPVMSILGKPVKGPKGDDLGRVVDVLADSSGRVRIAIIDFGGFLGVGDRRIAVDWPLLRFNTDGADPSLLLSVDRDKLKSAPEYKGAPRPQTLMEPPPAAIAPSPATDDKK